MGGTRAYGCVGTVQVKPFSIRHHVHVETKGPCSQSPSNGIALMTWVRQLVSGLFCVDVTCASRWVELVVRTLEASVRKGVTDKVAAVAEQLVWWVRARTKRPPMDFREAEDAPPPAPWKLEEAAGRAPNATGRA